MKLNREQIIKALECCIAFKSETDCIGCPSLEKCEESSSWLDRQILSLIKELTEENEDLKAQCRYTTEAVHSIKADTVRKMQERLKTTIADMEYNANIQRKTVRKEDLLEQVNWVFHEVVPDTIDQIAKEMLEEGK